MNDTEHHEERTISIKSFKNLVFLVLKEDFFIAFLVAFVYYYKTKGAITLLDAKLPRVALLSYRTYLVGCVCYGHARLCPG
jgi:hypothetical protein